VRADRLGRASLAAGTDEVADADADAELGESCQGELPRETFGDEQGSERSAENRRGARVAQRAVMHGELEDHCGSHGEHPQRNGQREQLPHVAAPEPVHEERERQVEERLDRERPTRSVRGEREVWDPRLQQGHGHDRLRDAEDERRGGAVGVMQRRDVRWQGKQDRDDEQRVDAAEPGEPELARRLRASAVGVGGSVGEDEPGQDEEEAHRHGARAVDVVDPGRSACEVGACIVKQHDVQRGEEPQPGQCGEMGAPGANWMHGQTVRVRRSRRYGPIGAPVAASE
jgi:hypothetical protein